MPVPKTLKQLINIARTQIQTIAQIWNEYGPGNLPIYNAIRRLFNLFSQKEAVTVYNEALSYSKTSAGQATLGQRPVFDPWDTPINPDLRSPFGDYGQFRYIVSFEFGNEWFSFIEWNASVPTESSLRFSVDEYIAEHIDVYPILNDIIQSGDTPPSQIIVRNPERRY